MITFLSSAVARVGGLVLGTELELKRNYKMLLGWGGLIFMLVLMEARDRHAG